MSSGYDRDRMVGTGPRRDRLTASVPESILVGAWGALDRVGSPVLFFTLVSLLSIVGPVMALSAPDLGDEPPDVRSPRSPSVDEGSVRAAEEGTVDVAQGV
ncbi:MAG: hypothetical protein R3324_07950, partial [Halobacteriales archaeon]|nr:hypothetical protein [Halobacteriales archaeon]